MSKPMFFSAKSVFPVPSAERAVENHPRFGALKGFPDSALCYVSTLSDLTPQGDPL